MHCFRVTSSFSCALARIVLLKQKRSVLILHERLLEIDPTYSIEAFSAREALQDIVDTMTSAHIHCSSSSSAAAAAVSEEPTVALASSVKAVVEEGGVYECKHAIDDTKSSATLENTKEIVSIVFTAASANARTTAGAGVGWSRVEEE